MYDATTTTTTCDYQKKKKTTATCHVVGFDIALMSFPLNNVVSKKWVNY